MRCSSKYLYQDGTIIEESMSESVIEDEHAKDVKSFKKF